MWEARARVGAASARHAPISQQTPHGKACNARAPARAHAQPQPHHNHAEQAHADRKDSALCSLPARVVCEVHVVHNWHRQLAGCHRTVPSGGAYVLVTVLCGRGDEGRRAPGGFNCLLGEAWLQGRPSLVGVERCAAARMPQQACNIRQLFCHCIPPCWQPVFAAYCCGVSATPSPSSLQVCLSSGKG